MSDRQPGHPWTLWPLSVYVSHEIYHFRIHTRAEVEVGYPALLTVLYLWPASMVVRRNSGKLGRTCLLSVLPSGNDAGKARFFSDNFPGHKVRQWDASSLSLFIYV